jgi:hypothetical protein
VKNRITALRAGLDARPTTDGDVIGGIVASPVVGRRDVGTPAGRTWPARERSASTPSDQRATRREAALMLDQHLTTDDMPLFTRLRMTAFGKR